MGFVVVILGLMVVCLVLVVGDGGKAKLVVLRPFEKDKQHNWMEAGRSGREKNNTNHIPDRSDSGYRAVQTTAAL